MCEATTISATQGNVDETALELLGGRTAVGRRLCRVRGFDPFCSEGRLSGCGVMWACTANSRLQPNARFEKCLVGATLNGICWATRISMSKRRVSSVKKHRCFMRRSETVALGPRECACKWPGRTSMSPATHNDLTPPNHTHTQQLLTQQLLPPPRNTDSDL